MKNLLNFISQHPDIIVRPNSTLDAVYLASLATIQGRQCSGLSGPLSSFQAVREWLGY